MWDGLHTVPTLDRTFWLQRADGSWVNQRGGPVTATLRGVVSYRIDGCDAEPMAHLCDLSVFKPARGPVRVQTLGPLRDETEAPWLLAPVACEVGSHAVLISRVAGRGGRTRHPRRGRRRGAAGDGRRRRARPGSPGSA